MAPRRPAAPWTPQHARLIKISLGNAFRRMTSVESELALWRDPRLAALAISAWPAWLWSADATRILWANAAGAALFGAADVGEFLKRRFDADTPAAAQILHLAATLPPAAAPRLERLRGFGVSALACECSRLAVDGEESAILVVAVEPVGPALPLSERVQRLLAGVAGSIAIFAADGALVHATSAARAELGGANSLAALGIDAIATKVLETGTARVARCGEGGAEATFQRLGSDTEHALALTLTSPPPSYVAAPSSPPPPPAAPPQDPRAETAVAERRHPLRFVWQMDAEGRFILGSDEFVALVGPRTMAAFGRKWNEIAAELKLDPDNQVGRAVASHETWSGIVVPWPVDDASERLPVELSGLPVFDRDRSFRGYRGFGVCRDVGRINELAKVRRERPIGFVAETQPPAEEEGARPVPQGAPIVDAAAPPEAATRVERAASSVPPVPTVAPAAANVVPFRASPAAEPKSAPTLSPVERKAFRELAQELTARLRGSQDAPVATEGALAEAPRAADNIAEAASTGTASGSAAAQASAVAAIDPSLFDRIPIGILVYRHDALIYANRHFLGWTGYDDLEALTAAGGLSALFASPGAGALTESGSAQTLSIVTRGGDPIAVDGRLLAVPWHGASALALVLTNGQAAERRHAAETALATVETELRNSRREAQSAAEAKADFVAKISHEIRTPLNAMIGFAEVMMTERFGPLGNERYREYLKDVHGAGTHVVALLNDLLDLSKVEAGKLDLNFGNVRVNELTQQCVGIMQPQASRARIIIRTSLTPALPQIVADERSMRQIVLNLLSNSIKFTGPGGQVIVSTAVSDDCAVVLRVRDTGVGMSEKDIAAALEPFRQAATSGSWGSGGSGLGLPLTKALAEANRAHFSIKSAPNAGTLVEIAFPANRVVAG